MELDRLKDIRLGGLGKILHRIVLILTYPLRHFFKFFALTFVAIVILAAIPMMKGVSYRHIPDWYLWRYNEVKEEQTLPVEPMPTPRQQFPKARQFKEVAAPKIIRKNSASEPATFGNRRAFKRAEAPFRRIEIKEEKTPTIAKPEKSLPPTFSIEKSSGAYYKIDKNLPLQYEDNPEEIKGKAIIFSANDLAVGEMYLYLYGIYTDPEKYDEQKARLYLEELTQNKTLTCKIVAYTLENIATGVCFIEGKSINQNLVDAGFADNVAL